MKLLFCLVFLVWTINSFSQIDQNPIGIKATLVTTQITKWSQLECNVEIETKQMELCIARDICSSSYFFDTDADVYKIIQIRGAKGAFVDYPDKNRRAFCLPQFLEPLHILPERTFNTTFTFGEPHTIYKQGEYRVKFIFNFKKYNNELTNWTSGWLHYTIRKPVGFILDN